MKRDIIIIFGKDSHFTRCTYMKNQYSCYRLLCTTEWLNVSESYLKHMIFLPLQSVHSEDIKFADNLSSRVPMTIKYMFAL